MGDRMVIWRGTSRIDGVTPIVLIATYATGAGAQSDNRKTGGSASFATIARVIALRFDLIPMPAVTSIDVLDPVAHHPFAAVEVADQVDSILEQLTARERLVLPLLADSSREVAASLGLGHSTVAKTQARLRDLLGDLIPDQDAEDIARELLDRLASRDSLDT